MALKSIMIAKKLELKRAVFEALVAKDAEFATRSAEIEKAIGEATTDEEQQAVEDAMNKFTEEQDAHNAEKKNCPQKSRALRKIWKMPKMILPRLNPKQKRKPKGMILP